MIIINDHYIISNIDYQYIINNIDYQQYMVDVFCFPPLDHWGSSGSASEITSSNHAKLTDFGGCRAITEEVPKVVVTEVRAELEFPKQRSSCEGSLTGA